MKNKILLFLLITFLSVGQSWGQAITFFSFTGSSGYSAPPATGWVQSGTIAGGDHLRLMPGSVTSPDYEAANSVIFYYSIASHSSGSDTSTTLAIYNSTTDALISSHTLTAAGSSSYIANQTVNIGNINSGFYVRIQGNGNGSTVRGTRLRNFELKGTAATPTLTLSSNITALNYAQGFGPSVGKTFTVSGTSLTGNVTLTAPTNFELSTTLDGTYSDQLTITASGTLATTTRYVRLKAGLTAGNYSGSVTATSSGATGKSITVAGTVTAPPPAIETDPTSLAFGNVGVGQHSLSQEVTVLAENLTGNIAVTAPTNFQVSLDGSTWQNAISLVQSGGEYLDVFFVRYSPTVAGTHSGNVTLVQGATTVNISVTGTGIACTPAAITFKPASGAPSGTLITITGSNFDGTSTVKFGGITSTDFLLISPTEIHAVVPDGVTANGLEVTTTLACPSTTAFTIINQDASGCN